MPIRRSCLLQQVARFLAIGQGQIQVLFLFVPDHAHADGSAVARPHRVHEIAGVVHRLVVDLHDHVSSAEAGLLRAAAFLDGAHQDAVTILHAEELSQLRGDVLHHQSAPRRGRDHHHVDRRNVDVGNVNLGNLNMKVFMVMAHCAGKLGVLVGQLYFSLLPVARHGSIRRLRCGRAASRGSSAATAPHSIAVPFMVRMTSCSLMPALPAGAS